MTGVAICWRSSAADGSVDRLGDHHQIKGTLAWNNSRQWRPEAKIPPAGEGVGHRCPGSAYGWKEVKGGDGMDK